MSKSAGKAKNILSNLLLIIGVLLVLAFAVYEGINYPWQQLLERWGLMEISTELADPAPLPDGAQNPNIAQNTGNNTTLPEQPFIFKERPQMNLELWGKIKIPKIQISENIVEGTGDELLYGVGHARGTAMPGQPGNCVLAGHRGYIYMRPFRYLDMLEPGDMVYVTDSENTYTYEVFRLFEANPDDSWIMHPQPEEEYLLTLLTCTPVVTYTKRLIVWCRLVDTQPIDMVNVNN